MDIFPINLFENVNIDKDIWRYAEYRILLSSLNVVQVCATITNTLTYIILLASCTM